MIVKPVNVYEDFYKKYGSMDHVLQEEVHITQEAVNNLFFKLFLKHRDAQMLPSFQRQINKKHTV